MNILIVQQLAWGLRIGHDVAHLLKCQGHQLSAFVHGREVKEFVDRQSEIPYHHVYFADPLYDQGSESVTANQILEIEERYDLQSIWRVIYSDRFLVLSFLTSRHFTARKPVSNEYLLSVCWCTYRLVRDILDRVKPDYVLAPVIGCLANYLLYLECQQRKIPFLTIGFSRFSNYFFISEDLYLGSCRIKARFEELKTCPEISPKYEEAQRIYLGISQNDPAVRPTYANGVLGSAWSPGKKFLTTILELSLLPARLGIGMLTALRQNRRVWEIRNIWIPTNSRWNDVRNVFISLRERIIRIDNQGKCLKSMDQVRFRYVYFPLHLEPELSLLVCAPEYTNQIELCRRVALALPQGVRLLVKEHPSMVSARPRQFYQDLQGLVNVELVHSSVSSHEIFRDKRCHGTLVIFSTVGFEAAMNGCPVVLLGPAEYAGLPTIYPAASLDDAIERLRGLCNGDVVREVANVNKANLAYLCALLENSFSFDYAERWNSGEGWIDAEALVQAVHQRLHHG